MKNQVIKSVTEIPAVAVNPMNMLQAALEKGVDAATLEKFMDLAERHEAKIARTAYHEAMSKFKTESMVILKNKQVTFGQTSYKHATLDNVCDAIVPMLSKHDLTHRWTVEQSDKQIKVTCVISHIKGHSEGVTLSAAADESGGKNNIQAVGSTVSYLERYTLLAATGIAVQGQDNDGSGVGGDTESTTLPEKEFKEFETRFKSAKTLAAAKNISKQATEACNKYKDGKSYEKLKEIYHQRVSDLTPDV